MFQLPNVISLLTGYQNGQQQGQQGQNQTQQQPSGNGFLQQAPRYQNEYYGKMVEHNGGAPTQDVLNHLNIYGAPSNLMNHHQKQAANNRWDDINGLYKEMLGREGEEGGLDYWTKTGQNADELRQDFANSPEYQNLVAQGLREQFDPAKYQQNKAASQNPDYLKKQAELEQKVAELESRSSYSGDSNIGWYGG